MVQFNLPVPTKQNEGQPGMYSFAVPQSTIMFAGSRHLELSHNTCLLMLHILGNLGFGFFIGCAKGVDQSFRKALAKSPYYQKGYVACAFKNRTALKHTYGLFAAVVVPAGLHPKAALHRRTLWMVKRCGMLFLFPDDPVTGRWGKGSKLAFDSALLHMKPVFVVTDNHIIKSVNYKIIPGSFAGEIPGHWVIPHTISEGGSCDYEF